MRTVTMVGRETAAGQGRDAHRAPVVPERWGGARRMAETEGPLWPLGSICELPLGLLEQKGGIWGWASSAFGD